MASKVSRHTVVVQPHIFDLATLKDLANGAGEVVAVEV